MSVLSVKTKNGLSPQGLPRIFFSCHPADFERYFETVCGDIFATQDCGIYYVSDCDNAAAESELKALLSDMQLFVVPVTRAFLNEESRAKSMEYGFAIQQHIPILPIAVENGLAEPFSQKMNKIGAGFGDVQFLDRTSTDTTEIPYGEKLKNRLETVLIGNELAERVRAAFDAYIFLSYRKKDRKKAGELMRLIHKIPFCRDIAIWYDEFLVPGEAWDEAIEAALEKSSLVTLLVTPSLLEPGNFIIEHEYPNAVAAGKRILPAEVVPTDRKELYKLFAGITEPFDGLDETVLAEKLKSAAVSKNNETSEHNYLIGLAYLGAIDVERNPEQAVELITAAAEAGLSEAMEKLADMYNSGEGVGRDYLTAAAWMERCCEALAKENANSITYYRALNKCGDMWVELGRLCEAGICFEKAMSCCEYLYQCEPTIEIRREMAVCCGNMVQSSYYEGKIEKAKEYCGKALSLRRALALETGTVEDRDFYSISCGDMGQICLAEGKIAEAIEFFEEALQVRSEITKESVSVKARRAYSVAHYNLARALEAAGKIDEAKLHFRYFKLISEDLAKETGSVQARHDLSVGYCDLGRMCEITGQLSEAKAYYLQYMKLSEELAAENGTIADRRELSGSYQRLGDICRAEGNLTEAGVYYERNLELDSEIEKETNMLMDRQSVAAAHFCLGYLCFLQGNYDEADANYRACVEITRRLAEESSGVRANHDYAKALWSMGILQQDRQEYKEALQYFTSAKKVYESLFNQTKSEQFKKNISVLRESILAMQLKLYSE